MANLPWTMSGPLYPNKTGYQSGPQYGYNGQMYKYADLTAAVDKDKASRASLAGKNQTTEDWVNFAKNSQVKTFGSPLYGGAEELIPWRGGYITKAELSAANWAGTKELEAEYKSKYDEAKAANESRYQDILGGYNQTYGNVSNQYDAMYGDVMGQFNGMGAAELAELRRQYGIAGNQQLSSLNAAGLMNSTVAPTMQRQNTDAQMRAESLLNERLQGQKTGTMATMLSSKIGALADIDAQKHGFMERREDEYPDFNQMLSLARGLGNT